MIKNIQEEILKLKKEKGVCILAHSYQSREIVEIADFVGDSFALSVKAAKAEYDTFLMCGVRFMAETVKILSPDKKVLLSNSSAGCPMAEQLTPAELTALKEQYPGYAVVAYINTTAALKTLCDVCVTSSSALSIVEKLDNDNIIFIPDINLGSYVKKMIPDKNIVLFNGGCPRHAAVTADEVLAAKNSHPGALFLVHPECTPDVTAMADYVGSTAGIMDYAKASDSKEFIIGTENSIVTHLQFECPGKKFYPVSKELICSDMKATTLYDVYSALNGEGGEEIILDPETVSMARKPIDEMIRLG
ncbi:MAG: quinolinate synthase NadA [Clostridia bacterium]|nr:quinolinate synthase NadA [Clostridia bacterium]